MGTISPDITDKNMKIKGITDEDFVNYQIPSMFISTATCGFKCDKECGRQICQNGDLVKMPTIDVPNSRIVDRYMSNQITKAVVLGGLEPMDQFFETLSLISDFRINGMKDDIVIYTGYNKEEVADLLNMIGQYGNIIIKFGRFIPDQDPHFDEVLGVYLASDNQYAERIS